VQALNSKQKCLAALLLPHSNSFWGSLIEFLMVNKTLDQTHHEKELALI